MNEVRVLTAVMILGLAPIACTRPTATPTTDAAAESERATQDYAHGALIQTPTPTVDATALAAAFATGEALPRDPTAEEMRDGRHFGGLKAMLPGTPPMLVVDPAVMFDGAEAEAAALADDPQTAAYNPNDFYIRDLDTTTVTLPISPTAVIMLFNAQDADHPDMAQSNVPVTDLLGWFAGTPVPPVAGRGWYGLWGDPAEAARQRIESDYAIECWITTRGGTVVAIEEQFLP